MGFFGGPSVSQEVLVPAGYFVEGLVFSILTYILVVLMARLLGIRDFLRKNSLEKVFFGRNPVNVTAALSSVYVFLYFAHLGLLELSSPLVAPLTAFVSWLLPLYSSLSVALIILGIGLLAGTYVEGRLRTWDTPLSDSLAVLLKYVVVSVSLTLAVPVVGLDPSIARTFIFMVLLALAIGFGGAFAIGVGLALKDPLSSLLRKKEYKMEKFLERPPVIREENK